MDNEMTTNTDISPENIKEKRAEDYFFRASGADFKKIPGSPIAYWVSENALATFRYNTLSEYAVFRAGLQTGDNDLFLRFWHEIDISKFSFNCSSRAEASRSGAKWFPHNKGGGYRKWHGNKDYVINWENDGRDLKQKKKTDLNEGRITPNNSKCWNQEYYFKNGLTWSSLSSGDLSLRDNGCGFLFDTKGQMLFPDNDNMRLSILSFLNSSVSVYYLGMLSPTLDYNGGVVAKVPFIEVEDEIIKKNTKYLVEISKKDWDSIETSWDFERHLLIGDYNLNQSFERAMHESKETISLVKRLEEKNNCVFIQIYNLEELSPVVDCSSITLNCNPEYIYGKGKETNDYIVLSRASNLKEIISYAIGCMMGRYSLDKPGLIYAHSGNKDFDPTRYTSFPADDDGIVPVMDLDWFDDDASKRFEEFLKVAWNEETLEENLKFVADSLAPKRDEEPRETIRRFISTKFFKDHHLKVYKKRPIYWLFSSGKNQAFECLVYLHRYNEKTLSRMRSKYVSPLQGKFNATIEYLQKEKEEAPSTSTTKSIQKQLTTMLKKQEELRAFDELLRHYADQRITLDLDDGVKVNYGKFGKLLAEVNAVTGKKAE